MSQADEDYDTLIRWAAGLNAPPLPGLKPVSNDRRNFAYPAMGGAQRPNEPGDGWLFFDEELGQPIWASEDRWLVAPRWLSGTALNATARGFAASVNHVWSGSTAVALTFTSTPVGRPGAVERIYFPSGTMSTLSLDSTLDPTQTLSMKVNTSLKAYLLTMRYFSDPYVHTTLEKLP